MVDVMVGNMAMSLLFWWSGLAHVGDVVCNMNVMVMVWNMMLMWFDDQLSMANSCIFEQLLRTQTLTSPIHFPPAWNLTQSAHPSNTQFVSYTKGTQFVSATTLEFVAVCMPYKILTG